MMATTNGRLASVSQLCCQGCVCARIDLERAVHMDRVIHTAAHSGVSPRQALTMPVHRAATHDVCNQGLSRSPYMPVGMHHEQELTESRFTSCVNQFQYNIQALQAVVARCKEAAHAFDWSAERARSWDRPRVAKPSSKNTSGLQKACP